MTDVERLTAQWEKIQKSQKSRSAPVALSQEPDIAIKVVRESGLPNETTSMFTTLEGEWDECMDVIKRACEAVQVASPRVSLVLKADIRPGYTGQLDAKVERVEARLAESN